MISKVEADRIAPPCPPVAVADVRSPGRLRWAGAPWVIDFLDGNELPRSTYRIELLNLDLPCLRIFAHDMDDRGRLHLVPAPTATADDIAVIEPRIVPLRTDWPQEWTS